MRLPMPAPVASHSTTVTASTEAGTAMRAAAKKAGSMAGMRTRTSRVSGPAA
jgi:hypothetical protein